MAVNPIEFTNFALSTNGLEEYILFSIGVAGKPALTTSRLLENLLTQKEPDSPFESVKAFKSEKKLCSSMKKVGFGCYNLKARGFWWIANSGVDLATCTVEDLEACPGIGMKTSRFFIMHTRAGDCNVACLDTHILKYMRDQGYEDIPKQTPARRRYLEIQDDFLNICREKGVHPAHFDLEIWVDYSTKKHQNVHR